MSFATPARGAGRGSVHLDARPGHALLDVPDVARFVVRGGDSIAVEPYGSVTTQGKAYRQPKQKLDFYTLLDNWLLKDQVPPVEQQHFVMAVLIRGGVFGDAG